MWTTRNWKTLSSGTLKVQILKSQITFLLAIVLSVLLRHTDSDCPFGIFKLFLFKSLWARKVNGINTMVKIWYGHLCLRGENISFNNTYNKRSVAIILISWNVIFIWETGYWTICYEQIRLIRSLKKFIFRYQGLVEIYSVSAEKIINDGFSNSENV